MRRKQILSLIPIVFAIFFLLYGGYAYWSKAFLLPGLQANLEKEEKQIRHLKEEIFRLRSLNEESSQNIKKYDAFRNGVHTANNIIKGEEAFRDKIASAAMQSVISTKSTGNMERIDVFEGFIIYEIRFTGEGSVKSLYDFLFNLREEKPFVFLKRLTIKPDKPNNPEGITIDGTFMMPCFISDAEDE